MHKHGINHYSTYSTKKAATIAERTIRSPKHLLFTEFSVRESYRWINILADVTDFYNNRKHRTTGESPIAVDFHTRLNVYNHPKVAGKGKLKPGDIVRLSKYKSLFEKGYTSNYSSSVTYMLEDVEGCPIKGCFYEKELRKIKFPNEYLIEKVIRRKGNKLLVKWLGFPHYKNSWIDINDVL
ncbi:unnamed protein product [Acanthoscelides obtectus]|uniref:Chromo domain-containing protein n=1 Tax=Acanthoscelides obtectus TaxID=200917 RepID=A0A9P0PB05_ACAOB|nr:unnamed protein product [Acanthoscelides obtectus]CAK1664832.1 hypothetical protein AOBTE_LOCUS24494 [Acanthoscelides obtectus]